MGLDAIPKNVKEKIERVVSVIKSGFCDSEVFLFGSFARGDWLEDSDLDFLVVSDKFEGVEYVKRIALVKSELLRRGVAGGVHIVPLTRREFEERRRGSVIIEDALEYAVKL